MLDACPKLSYIAIELINMPFLYTRAHEREKERDKERKKKILCTVKYKECLIETKLYASDLSSQQLKIELLLLLLLLLLLYNKSFFGSPFFSFLSFFLFFCFLLNAKKGAINYPFPDVLGGAKLRQKEKIQEKSILRARQHVSDIISWRSS